jgi:DNA-directed RNA polymerase specialized sigma24 family protein
VAARRPEADPVEERLDDIARLLYLLVRGESSLQDAVSLLAGAGISQSSIARITGSTSGNVRVMLARAQKKKPSRSAKKSS